MPADARIRFLDAVDRYAALLAKTVVERDLAGADPHAEVAAARDAGLLPLMAPAADGGLGGDWATAFEATRRIARVDGSLAQLIGYHWLNEATIGFVLEADARSTWYRRSVEGRWFWADSINPLDPDLVLTRTDDGWLLDGAKRYASGAVVADRILASAVRTDEPGRPDEPDAPPLFLAVPADRDGVEHAGDWDNVGQRLTASGSVRYTAVRIDDADVLGPVPRHPFAALQPPGIHLMYSCLYAGLAEGAVAQARGLVLARDAARPTGAPARAEDPAVQRLFGEWDARIAAVVALAQRTADEYDAAVRHPDLDWDTRADIAIAVARLKVVATETVLEVTAAVFEATGASSTRRDVGLDRYWRDARTHTLHDPVDLKRREVGARLLSGTAPKPSLYS